MCVESMLSTAGDNPVSMDSRGREAVRFGSDDTQLTGTSVFIDLSCCHKG
jgi:hypothetical protein